MPGLVAPTTDEKELLLGFLAQQRDALRYATHGLAEPDACAAPTVSQLNLAGLIKHVTRVEQAWTSYIREGDTAVFVPDEDWADGFRLVDGETLEGVLAGAAAQAGETERLVRSLPDLGAPLPPTVDLVPWIPAGLVWTPRWILLHLIEELARHAGHADIVREAIDGSTCWALMAAAEGWPVQEWA